MMESMVERVRKRVYSRKSTLFVPKYRTQEEILKFNQQMKEEQDNLEAEWVEWAKNYKKTGDTCFLSDYFKGDGIPEMYDALADAILAGKRIEFLDAYQERFVKR